MTDVVVGDVDEFVVVVVETEAEPSFVDGCTLSSFTSEIVDFSSKGDELVTLADDLSIGSLVMSSDSTGEFQSKLVVSDDNKNDSHFRFCSLEQFDCTQAECHLLNLLYKC